MVTICFLFDDGYPEFLRHGQVDFLEPGRDFISQNFPSLFDAGDVVELKIVDRVRTLVICVIHSCILESKLDYVKKTYRLSSPTSQKGTSRR